MNTTVPLFLTRVAKKTLAYNAQDTIVVLPNRRAGIFLKNAIAKLIKQPSFLPNILTIEDFFLDLSGLVKIDQVEQLFRLYESHRASHPEPDQFDSFMTWGPTFLSDCGEIDTNLIDPETFFNTLYADREIRNWNVADENTEMQQRYLAFWKRAKSLYFDFTNSLLKEGRAYNGLAYRVVIEKIEHVFPNQKKVIFAGFNALNRAEEALFDYVYKNNLGEFLWDFDSYYTEDDENKAGMYLRDRYRPKWTRDKGLQASPKRIGKQTEQIQIIEAPNNVSQCEIAAQLVKDLANKGALDEKTAIVLADEKLLEPLLYQLPKSVGTYNITMGKAVSDFPIYHLFIDYFQLQKSVASQTTKTGYATSFIKPLLLSPFVQALAHDDCVHLYDYLLENNISFLRLQDIKEEINNNNILYQLLQPVANLEEMITQTHQLIEALRIELHQTEGGLVRQVLFEIKKILEQFTTFEVNLSTPIGIGAFQNLFKQVAQSTRIPYEGEPLSGLQIMGVLETRCLDFENIILLSANEGILPKGRNTNSFIPYIFKKEFEIQTSQDKDAIYAYSIYRLLHYAKKIYFVYNGQPDILSGGEVSRFVAQIEAEFPKKVAQKIPLQRLSAHYATISIQKNEYQIEKTPKIIDQIWNYLELSGLSPSALKLLINSPLDFYFERIAKVKSPREFEQDIELNSFGTIVHDSLETLYKPLVGKILSESMLNDIERNIVNTVEQKIKQEFKKGNIETGKNYLYVRAAHKLVKEAILLDKKRIKHHQIKLLSVEEPLDCNILIEAPGKILPLKLHGKADRIQQRDDKIEIIDYKTGKVDEAKLKSKSINKISEKPDYEKLNQLLCYTTMAHHGKHNVALADIHAAMQPLKSWNVGLCFINKDPNYSISQEELKEYKTQITIAIRNLLDPNIPFLPESDVNQRLLFSNYKSIYL